MTAQPYARKHDLQSLLDCIIRHKRTHDGNSPTIRELMKATGISSTSAVAYNLGLLERAGDITRRGGKIFVVGGQWIFVRKSKSKKETA